MKNTSKDKLKELIVYIAQKCADDPNFGKTKLNKILFYADFNYYIRFKESISGQDYIHLDHGPVPEDMNFTTQEMNKKDIAFAITNSGPYVQNRVVALREPNLSIFKADMISLLDDIINLVCFKNHVRAAWLSEASHDFLGWLVTETGEKIPYSTAFLRTLPYQKVTEREKLKGEQLVHTLSGKYGFA